MHSLFLLADMACCTLLLFLEAIVKELVVNAADQMGSFSPQLWLRVFTMHWAVDNRWDCCSLFDQSEGSRCLASACKPLFGIWGLMGVGLIITVNPCESGLYVFFYFYTRLLCETVMQAMLPEPHILSHFCKKLQLNKVSFCAPNTSDDNPPSYLISPS